MKKYSKKYFEHLLRKSEKAQIKLIKKNRPKKKSRYNSHHYEYSVLCPPQIGLLGKYGPATFDFIAKIKSTAAKHGRVKLGLQQLKKINADAMVLLQAEVTALLHNNVGVTVIKPKTARERAVLSHTGFFALLGTTSKIKTEIYESVYRWQVECGNKGIEGERISNMLESSLAFAQEVLIDDTLLFKIKTGISEAVSNTMLHAYIDERNGGFSLDTGQLKWWAFACFNKEDKSFTLISIDLGIGMARSIDEVYDDYRRKQQLKSWAWLRDKISGKKDHEIIRLLAESNDNLSSTKETYRGLGLQTDIIGLSKNYPNIDIAIYSNKGYYSTFNDKTTSKELADNVNGTIVAWTIKL